MQVLLLLGLCTLECTLKDHEGLAMSPTGLPLIDWAAPKGVLHGKSQKTRQDLLRPVLRRGQADPAVPPHFLAQKRTRSKEKMSAMAFVRVF
jgi:hypothetical protein